MAHARERESESLVITAVFSPTELESSFHHADLSAEIRTSGDSPLLSFQELRLRAPIPGA